LPTTRTTTEFQFDCAADYTDCYKCLVQKWSAEKLAWCCRRRDRGCAPTTTPIHFDCKAGRDRWEKEWSEAKKVWCCKHAATGCSVMSA
jgi:hypothetical protein